MLWGYHCNFVVKILCSQHWEFSDDKIFTWNPASGVDLVQNPFSFIVEIAFDDKSLIEKKNPTISPSQAHSHFRV